MNYQRVTVKLGQLLLDPNNYRFLDMQEHTRVDPARFHEDSVQDRAQKLIEKDGFDELRALKESIQTNGYIPIEALVVRTYRQGTDKFVVVEGNRRVAAMRWLMRDRSGGVSVSEELIKSFDELPVIPLDPESQDFEDLQHVLMGLRHVSGIKEWGGYQRAKLVVELVDEHQLPLADAAKRIGMSSSEAKRRYRAYKALDQMQKDEEFGSYVTARLYPLFHEAVAQPKVRDWLSWEENRLQFGNTERRRQFYLLLIPFKPDDDEEMPRPLDPKIRTYADVRSLAEVLDNEEAEESLLDLAQPFADALAIAKASTSPNWLPRLKAAHQALDRISVPTLKNLAPEAIQPMLDLYRALRERLDDWGKLTGNQVTL
jgi:hypothetical protein